MEPHISPENENGCFLWTGPKNKCKSSREDACYGRIRARFPDDTKSRHYYAHRLTYMIHHNITSIPHNLHISHLCHNTLCVNIQHLSAEPQYVNNTRQRCSCDGVCSKHSLGDVIYPDCMFKLKVCFLLFRFCNAPINVFPARGDSNEYQQHNMFLSRNKKTFSELSIIIQYSLICSYAGN